MKFKNPENGYVKEIYGNLSWLWVLLIGPIYWAVKGVWRHAVVLFIFAAVTFGVAHLIYPFLTYSILRKHYNKIGWREIKK